MRNYFTLGAGAVGSLAPGSGAAEWLTLGKGAAVWRCAPAVWVAMLLAGCAAPASAAGATTSPQAIQRAQAELARLRSVPPAVAGVVDLAWSRLTPPQWKPGRTLDRLGADKLQDDDPGAPAVLEQVRREWADAPSVDNLGEAPVRLVGYPLASDGSGRLTRIVVLAPYSTFDVRRPPPAPNQLVLVALQRELPPSLAGYPIWVTGRITTRSVTTPLGRVAYQMGSASWEPYPYQKYPVPAVRFAR